MARAGMTKKMLADHHTCQLHRTQNRSIGVLPSLNSELRCLRVMGGSARGVILPTAQMAGRSAMPQTRAGCVLSVRNQALRVRPCNHSVRGLGEMLRNSASNLVTAASCFTFLGHTQIILWNMQFLPKHLHKPDSNCRHVDCLVRCFISQILFYL